MLRKIVNLKSMKSTRMIGHSELYSLCNEKQYYTCGTSEEYSQFLDKVLDENHNTKELTDDLLMDLASDIFCHSDVNRMMQEYGCCEDDVLCNILFEIVAKSYTTFTVNATYHTDCY